MKTTNKLRTLLAGCAIFATSFAGAAVVYDAGQWDPNAFTPISRSDNALYGSSVEYTAGEFVNNKNGAILKEVEGGYTYYEDQQSGSEAYLTDGAAPNMPGSDYNVQGRRLIENFAVYKFTLAAATDIKSFKFYTQWDDGGYRNDVSVDKIETSSDGEHWIVVPGSKFDYSQTQDRNTVGEYVGSSAKRRYVKMYDNGGSAIAVGAKYVRITFGIQNVGYGAYWEIEAEKGGTVIEGVSAEAIPAVGSATVSGMITSRAQGTAAIRFGSNPANLHRTVDIELAGTGITKTFSRDLSDLVSDSEYTYAVEYSVGGEIALAVTNTFKTSYEKGVELPGLWQARLANNLNTTDGLSASEIAVARALGPIMGFEKVTSYDQLIHNDVDNKDYAWDDYKTYLYQGFISMEAGVTYTFWTCQDDDGRIAIDGIEVERSSGCGSASGDFTPTTTGWHAIDIRVGNGGGHAGNNDGWLGVGYHIPGGDWRKVLDSGDGSFLCCTQDGKIPGTFKVVSTLNDNGSVTVILDGQFESAASVRAWCGETRGGIDPASWGSVNTSVGTFPAGVDHKTFTFTVPQGTMYVRFAAYGEGDVLLCLSQSVPVVDMEEPSSAPSLDCVSVSDIDESSAKFTFAVMDAGDNAEWTAKVFYGYSASDLEYEESIASGSGAAFFSGRLSGLLPGTKYFAKLVVDNGAAATETKVMTFTTETFSEPEAGARAISLGTASVSAAGVSGALKLAVAEAASDIYMVYGPAFGGDGVSGWASSVKLGSAPAAATSFELSATLPSNSIGDTVKYVRFCAVTGEGTSWTAPIALGNGDLPVFAAVTGFGSLSLGDTISVGSSLVYADGSCSVSVEVSRTGDFTDAVSYPCGTIAAGGKVEKTLHAADKTSPEYIVPGETVYIRLRAEDGNGIVGYSGIETLRPYGAPVIGTLTASYNMNDLTINGSLDEYGANSGEGCSVELWIAKKGGTLEKVAVTNVVEGSGFSFVYVVPEFGEYTYQVRATSECATASFNVASVEYAVNVVDDAWYYWKADVDDGDWSNPDNWECSKAGSDGRKYFPNSPYCAASFERRGTEPTTVNLDGKYDVYMISFSNEMNAKLTIAGQGTPGEDNELHVTWGDYGLRFPVGTDFTLSNAYLRCDGKLLPNKNSKTRILYGSTLDLNTEFWWRADDASYDADLEIRGRSKLYLRNYSLRCQGGNGTVILDDSTIYSGDGTNPHGVQIEYVKQDTDGIQFIVMGEQPQFLVNYVRLDHTNCGGFTFIVPEGGYKAPVFSQYPRTQGSKFNPYMEDNACIPFAVSQDSPALKSKVKCKLIDWPGTVSPVMLDLSLPEKYETRASFRWTYGDNNAATGEVPTGLWLDCKGGGTVVKIR